MRSVWSALEGEEWGDLGGILSQEVRSHRVISALWFPTKWTARGYFFPFSFTERSKIPKGAKGARFKGNFDTWNMEEATLPHIVDKKITHQSLCCAGVPKTTMALHLRLLGGDVYFISSSVAKWKSLYKTYLNGIKTVILSPPIPSLSSTTAEWKYYIFKNFNIYRKSCHMLVTFFFSTMHPWVYYTVCLCEDRAWRKELISLVVQSYLSSGVNAGTRQGHRQRLEV